MDLLHRHWRALWLPCSCCLFDHCTHKGTSVCSCSRVGWPYWVITFNPANVCLCQTKGTPLDRFCPSYKTPSSMASLGHQKLETEVPNLFTSTKCENKEENIIKSYSRWKTPYLVLFTWKNDTLKPIDQRKAITSETFSDFKTIPIVPLSWLWTGLTSILPVSLWKIVP